MTRTRRLRDLIARPRLLVLPSTYDPLLARCVEQAGFEALYMAGSGVANGTLAVPDLGMVTFPEMLERARLLADVTSLPLLADAEDGFGAPLDIMRTVRSFDPCLPCGVHMFVGEGKILRTYHSPMFGVGKP